MARRVLNEPALASVVEPGAVAERLQRAMLAALGAHTDARGRVDYARLAASDAFAAAEAAARALGGARLDALAGRGERLAFWINVYNALVLHGIVRLGVRSSVRRTWNFFGRVCYRMGASVFSLDDIEHGVLRDNRWRPWPPLRPFGAGDPRRALAAIDGQLDLATRNFVNQEIVLAGGRLACSRLFKWYRRDFEAAGGLTGFLLRHLDPGPARAALEAGAAPCAAFRPYRWTLQHQPAD